MCRMQRKRPEQSQKEQRRNARLVKKPARHRLSLCNISDETNRTRSSEPRRAAQRGRAEKNGDEDGETETQSTFSGPAKGGNRGGKSDRQNTQNPEQRAHGSDTHSGRSGTARRAIQHRAREITLKNHGETGAQSQQEKREGKSLATIANFLDFLFFGRNRLSQILTDFINDV